MPELDRLRELPFFLALENVLALGVHTCALDYKRNHDMHIGVHSYLDPQNFMKASLREACHNVMNEWPDTAKHTWELEKQNMGWSFPWLEEGKGICTY